MVETKKQKDKVRKVMREFKHGELHSGSKKGPKVTNPKQAIAIGLSEAGVSKPSSKHGKALAKAVASRIENKKHRSAMYS